MPDAHADITIDDTDVRVTTWTFDGLGAETGPHVHEHDYLVVPVTGGTFTVVAADGATREMTQRSGASYRGCAGIDHNVINASDRPAIFVEVELKR